MKMLKSLFSKIMGSYILIPIVILIALFVFLPYNLENYLAQQKKEELVKNGKEVVGVIENEAKVDVDRILSSFAESLESNLILINQQGQIINRSQGMVSGWNQMPNNPMMRMFNNRRGMMNSSHHMMSHRDNQKMNSSMQFRKIIGLEEELKEVLAGELVTFRGKSSMISQPIIAVGVPIVNKEEKQALFLISPLHGFKDAIDNIRMLTLQVVIGAIILALILGYFISKGITEPIAKMKDKVKQITAGDFSTKIEKLPDDELGELGRSFNYMSQQLETNLDELATEKNRMQEMLTSMTEGVLGIAATGEIMLANSVAKDILNHEQEIVGQDFSEILQEELIDLIKNVLADKEEQEIEFELFEQIVTAQAAPVKKSDEQLWGVIILVSDVTEIRRLDKMRRLFVANVSHELKTPLTAIQGYLEGILDGMVENEELEREYLQRVLAETDRMSRLVADVLDLAQLQSEQFEFQLEPVDLNTVVRSVSDNLETSFGKRELILDVPQNITVKADRDKLEEVLINLLSNALKFTEQDGKIEVRAELKENKVAVSVSDNGVGIPKGELNHIWDRFHQVDRARKPDQEGTGLGLAIVKEIVEGMNGEIAVESTVGAGSKFIFSLELFKKGV
ncbi:MAG: ATP-binding protein [Bacillota bacterium]